jgi:hypothetical protein
MIVVKERTIKGKHYSVVKRNNRSHPKGEECTRRRMIRKR